MLSWKLITCLFFFQETHSYPLPLGIGLTNKYSLLPFKLVPNLQNLLKLICIKSLGSVNRVMLRNVIISSGAGQAGVEGRPDLPHFPFLWCEYSHPGWFQASNVMSLMQNWKDRITIGLCKPIQVGSHSPQEHSAY